MTVSGGTEGGFIFLGSVRRAQSQANRLFDAWPVSPSSRASRPSDFSYQPSLDKKQIQTLATCHFIEHGENVVLLGPPDPTT